MTQANDYGQLAYRIGKKNIKDGNYEDGLRSLLAAAREGYEPAYFQLGYMYYRGIGVEQDTNEAIKWYRLSAAMGNKDADHNLATIGSKSVVKETIKWGVGVLSVILFVISVCMQGCTNNKNNGDNTAIQPPGAGQGIGAARTSTTRISGNLAETKVVVDDDSAKLQETTTDIQNNVNKGRIVTPEQSRKDLFPIWDNIDLNITKLWYIKSQNDRVSEQIKAQKQQMDYLAEQLDEAKKANIEREQFWVKRDKENQQVITNQGGEITKLNTKLADQHRAKLFWLIVTAIAVAGISVFVASFTNSKIGIAGVLGAGTVIILSLIVSEVTTFMASIEWMYPWMVGTVFVLGIAYVTWRIITNRIATTQIVQANETLKQNLPDDKRLKLFGDHAELGVFEDRFYFFTKKIVAQARKHVKTAKAVKRVQPNPDDNVVITG